MPFAVAKTTVVQRTPSEADSHWCAISTPRDSKQASQGEARENAARNVWLVPSWGFSQSRLRHADVTMGSKHNTSQEIIP